jgi:hypothetical protein
MSKRRLVPHLVAIPATTTHPHDVAGLLEIGHDALDGALGDSHQVRDVSHPDFGLPCEAQ